MQVYERKEKSAPAEAGGNREDPARTQNSEDTELRSGNL